MAATYTQISRSEFEEWLDAIGYRGKWDIKQNTGGVYWIYLSEFVAVEINSTTGSSDTVMERGEASMSLRLVSRISGRVLNKKAMRQSHFARTTGWKKNWKTGVERMVEAYVKSKDFYDKIASVADLREYKQSWLREIERVPNWKNVNFLVDLRSKVEDGGVLSDKQEAAIRKMVDQAPTPPETPTVPEEHPLVAPLRLIYAAARREDDQWTMTFAQSIAGQVKTGRQLSEAQMRIVIDKARVYKVKLPVN